MISLYPRHFLDIETIDLVRSASGYFSGNEAGIEARNLESDIGSDSLVTLSVRSALDLLLTSLDLPAGSEVIMSAVTIPDMVRIVEAHGLTVVPVDLDPMTMAPRIDIYSRAFSEQTRLVILAHLLGGSFDIAPYADIADLHGVPVIEDCAQAFAGPDDWGSRRATASLFSFGSIKTCTALGGAVSIVRHPLLLDRMREIQSQWPVQAGTQFTNKAARYLGVQSFRSPVFYARVASVAARTAGGLDSFIARTVRGFAPGSLDVLLQNVRQRPCGAQVALLRHRFECFTGKRLRARVERGELLMKEFSLVCNMLGQDQPRRTHWLFAVVVDEPQNLIASLRRAGFDATQGATSIGPVTAPAHMSQFEARKMRAAMSRAVFLPAYPEMPARDAGRMVNAVFSFVLLRPPSTASDLTQRSLGGYAA